MNIKDTTAPILSARGVHHSFGQTEALRGIDLDVQAGEVLAVCVRLARGIPKLPQAEVTLEADCGIVGDRHAGSRNRQVSLIEQEVLEELAAMGMPVGPGVLTVGRPMGE